MRNTPVPTAAVALATLLIVSGCSHMADRTPTEFTPAPGYGTLQGVTSVTPRKPPTVTGVKRVTRKVTPHLPAGVTPAAPEPAPTVTSAPKKKRWWHCDRTRKHRVLKWCDA